MLILGLPLSLECNTECILNSLNLNVVDAINHFFLPFLDISEL